MHKATDYRGIWTRRKRMERRRRFVIPDLKMNEPKQTPPLPPPPPPLLHFMAIMVVYSKITNSLCVGH